MEAGLSVPPKQAERVLPAFPQCPCFPLLYRGQYVSSVSNLCLEIKAGFPSVHSCFPLGMQVKQERNPTIISNQWSEVQLGPSGVLFAFPMEGTWRNLVHFREQNFRERRTYYLDLSYFDLRLPVSEFHSHDQQDCAFFHLCFTPGDKLPIILHLALMSLLRFPVCCCVMMCGCVTIDLPLSFD